MIKDADAINPKPLMLSDEESTWKTNIYFGVRKEVPGAEMTKISGKFLTKVFEGHYKNMKNWMEEMKEYVKSKDKKIKKCISSIQHFHIVLRFMVKTIQLY